MQSERGLREGQSADRGPGELTTAEGGVHRTVQAREHGRQPYGRAHHVLVMHLRAQKAAEREHQPAAERGQWLEPQRAQIDVGEQTRQEHMQRAQPDHRRWRRQQVQQRELRQVGQTELAVGEDGITGEDVRQPEREHPRVQLLADPLGQRIVKEPRVQLVKGGSAEQPVAVQHESARGDRQHCDEVRDAVPGSAFGVPR